MGEPRHGQFGELGRDGAGKGSIRWPAASPSCRYAVVKTACSGGQTRPWASTGRPSPASKSSPAAGGGPAVNGKAAFNELVLQAADLEQIARIGQHRPVQLGQAGAAGFTLEPGLPAQHVAEGGLKLGLARAHAPLIFQRAGQAGGQSPQGEKVGRGLPFGRSGQGELL